VRTGIIIVNWNGYDDTRECLLSLCAVEHTRDILVVDNGSGDGSGQRLATEFPAVSFLFTGRNLGFAGGNNLGIQYWFDRGCDAVFLLNNDTIIRQPFIAVLERLCGTLPEVGVIGPLVMDAAHPERIQAFGGKVDMWSGRSTYLQTGESRGIDHRTVAVDYVLGAAFMIPRHTFETIGLLDERYYPAYFEEADYCWRARGQGLRSYVTEETAIWHKGGRSSGGLAIAFRRIMRHKWLFEVKHARFYHWPSFALIWSLHYIWRTLIRPF
jgi:GT2 family glycosyltransferase